MFPVRGVSRDRYIENFGLGESLSRAITATAGAALFNRLYPGQWLLSHAKPGFETYSTLKHLGRAAILR